jgi:transposase
MPDAIDPQLLEEVARARTANDAPAWVTTLMELVTSLQALVVSLQQQVEDLKAENALLRNKRFGRSSERSKAAAQSAEEPVPARPARPPRRGPSALDEATLPEEVIHHPVPTEERRCPVCCGVSFTELPAEVSLEYELAFARLVRRRHHRQKLACRCGGHIQTAPAPTRLTDGGRFGPALHADTVVRRCMDAIPIHRMADMYQRSDIPLSESTLNDIFHQTAGHVQPLYDALQQEILQAPVVHADETPHRVLGKGKCTLAFLWSFSSPTAVFHVHAADRSGATPILVLKDSLGVVVADGFSGYNAIETPTGRRRQGCMAHARRKFHDALGSDPERARVALRMIQMLYAWEKHIREACPEDPAAALTIREAHSRPVMESLKQWLDEQVTQVRPKSVIGRAVGYMRAQWRRLELFLEDPAIPIDNNEAERQLRRPVLGRKTSLFVANHESGQRYAVLNSVVLTCRKVGVNPTEYVTWVLPRIKTWPEDAIADLLPHRYTTTRRRLENTS